MSLIFYNYNGGIQDPAIINFIFEILFRVYIENSAELSRCFYRNGVNSPLSVIASPKHIMFTRFASNELREYSLLLVSHMLATSTVRASQQKRSAYS